MISYENQTPYGEGDAAIEPVRRKLVDYESTWRRRLTEATEDHAKNQQAFDEAVKARRAELDSQVQKIRTDTDALVAASQSKIDKLEELFNQEIQLDTVQYWREKAGGHNWGVWIWGLLLALISLAPLIAIGVFAHDAYQWFHAEQSSLTTAGVAILLTVAVLYLAFGRLVARLFSTSLALRSDASERVVMAQTFLTLCQDGKLTEEERKLVLVPLFPSPGAGAEGKK